MTLLNPDKVVIRWICEDCHNRAEGVLSDIPDVGVAVCQECGEDMTIEKVEKVEVVSVSRGKAQEGSITEHRKHVVEAARALIDRCFPENIFDGSSGDEGTILVCQLREALRALALTQEESQ